MEPTSNPDNARPTRGLARLWPAHRDGEDTAAPGEPTEMPATPSSETEMVALGSRRAAEGGGPLEGASAVRPPLSPTASAAPGGPGGPGGPGERPEPLSSPPGSGGGVSGPGGGMSGRSGAGAGRPAPVSGPPAVGRHDAGARDDDHSGPAAAEEPAAPAVESSRTNPWDRDPSPFGGFDLGGRNGRFLFGGRHPAEPPAGLNGHGPAAANGVQVNGRTTDTEPERAEPADRSDENGRDDMNGRTGQSDPATPESGSDPTEARRQAAGWASVPTTTHPVVSPTSGVPTSGGPVSSTPVSSPPVSSPPVSSPPASSPVSPGHGFDFGRPPGHTPALPDPAAGPVSGVPAPRAAAASIPVPVAPVAKPPAERDELNIAFGGSTDTPPPAGAEDAPAPRRSASLEDAEPVRRGRRAAAEEPAHTDAPLRPGDVAAGQIAFWDEDATRHFRAAWHEVKAEFVDDPVAALTRAHELLTDAVNELTEALLAERDELDPLRAGGTPDTESMRMAMRGYREFLDRILAL